MKALGTLIRKELRQMKPELLSIVVIQYCLILSITSPIIKFTESYNRFDHMIEDMIPMSYYLYPLLLLWSLFMETKTGTVYQWHSLPLKKTSTLIAKFTAVASAMAGSILISVVILYIKLMIDLGSMWVSIPKHLYMALFVWSSDPFILLCLVCTIWGLMQTIRRNRLAFGFAITIAGFFIYKLVMDKTGVFLQIERDTQNYYTTSFRNIGHYTVYALPIGMLFLLIGLIFYEKYGEV